MTGFHHLHLTTDEHDILWLTLDVQGEPRNILGPEVLDELARACTEIRTRNPRGMVLCSGKPSGFIVGADIRLFRKVENSEQALAFIHKGQQVCQQFEDLPCPTLAMIHGFCAGGGMELALALDYRIASDSPATRLGLPEIKLGIHPGFGGTVRSIAKTGVLNAMELMLKGTLLPAEDALKTGLIDRCVATPDLRNTAIQTLLKPPAKAKPPLHIAALGKLAPSRKLLAAKLRQQAAEHARPDQYPAPYALIELWEKHGNNPAEMYKAEATSVARLIMGKTAQNLVRVFFLKNRLKALGDKALFQPKQVFVFSDTDTGKNITAWCIRHGLHTTLEETGNPDSVLITQADIIIESMSGNRQTKQKLLAFLEQQIKPDAILATNTADIPLEDIAGTMHNPSRLIGLHFCEPIAEIPLVEVVYDPHDMDGAIITRAKSFVRHIDKLPLPVQSSPGLLVNRILNAYIQEGIRLQQQGIPAMVIDAAARAFGMPMGPLEMADHIGLDACQNMGERIARKLGSHDIPLAIYHMTKAGKLGKKSGTGFYHYRHGKMMKEDKVEWQGNRDLLQGKLINPMINEAGACLEQGIVEDADLVDAALIFGAGFAAFRGGPLHYSHKK